MNYADTYIGQRVEIVANHFYPDTCVGMVGTITERYEGIDPTHGTVAVKLDGVKYPLEHDPRPNWITHTHMAVNQLAPADELLPQNPETGSGTTTKSGINAR